MTKRLVCPNNPKHNRFYAHAQVSEEWIVNERLDWEETVEGSSDCLRYPEFGDDFICADCERKGDYDVMPLVENNESVPATLTWCTTHVMVNDTAIHEWMDSMQYMADFYAKARREWNDERKLYVWFGDEVEPVGGVYDWRKCITQQLMAEAEGLE